MKSQLICAVVIQYYLVSHDIKHFPKPFSQMYDVIPMNTMVLEKGYDAESVHKQIRDKRILDLLRNYRDFSQILYFNRIHT